MKLDSDIWDESSKVSHLNTSNRWTIFAGMKDTPMGQTIVDRFDQISIPGALCIL